MRSLGSIDSTGHSLSSALQARASSIRNVKLSGVLHSVSKRSMSGSLNTPGSTGVASSSAQAPHPQASFAGIEEEKSTDAVLDAASAGVGGDNPATGQTDGRERRSYAAGTGTGSSKNVAWKDGGEESVGFRWSQVLAAVRPMGRWREVLVSRG